MTASIGGGAAKCSENTAVPKKSGIAHHTDCVAEDTMYDTEALYCLSPKDGSEWSYVSKVECEVSH